MSIRVNLVDPRDGSESPILNGTTNRPFSWPSRAAAQADVDHYTQMRTWNSFSDDWSYEYRIFDFKKEEKPECPSPSEETL